MIREGSSPIHGCGIFAERAIACGEAIVEYRGRLVDKRESWRLRQEGNTRVFYFSDVEDLDGDLPENRARWINHSCAPNSEVRKLDGRLWIIAIQSIPAGQEITYDYGLNVEELRRLGCCCGAPLCRAGIPVKTPAAWEQAMRRARLFRTKRSS